MAIRYRYTVADGSLVLNGIPPRDLDDADVAALSPEQRAMVADSAIYEDVKQGKATKVAEGEDE